MIATLCTHVVLIYYSILPAISENNIFKDFNSLIFSWATIQVMELLQGLGACETFDNRQHIT